MTSTPGAEETPVTPRVVRPRPRAPRTRARRVPSWMWFAASGGVVALSAAAWILGRPYDGVVPPGVRIGGVALGDRSDADAARALAAAGETVIRRGLVLTSGSQRFRLRLRSVGAAPDTQRVLREAHGAYGFFARVRARLGAAPGASLPLRFRYDEAALGSAIAKIAGGVEQPAEAATIRVSDDDLSLAGGRAGVAIDRAALHRGLVGVAAAGGTLELPLRALAPPTSRASARRALERARTLLATAHVLVLAGREYPFSQRALRRALTFVPVDGELTLRLARPPIADEVHRMFGGAETEPRNARFAVDRNEKLRVIESRNGYVVDPEAIRSALERDPARREVPVRIAAVPAKFTTANARALGATDEVASFTTPYEPDQPRVTNIQHAAELLDGTILKAGASFDLNQRLGERTVERGFVMAPMIDEGRLRDAIGGGVSQVATTLYNAAFFAGLQLVAHTPHAFYISRYPPGREATVSWGGPELVFANDWRAPLVILVDAAHDRITVRMFSRKLGRRVETDTSEPTNFEKAKVTRVVNPALASGQQHVIQQGGQEGFDVSYWRKVYGSAGLVSEESWKVHYRPEDTIIETGPPAAPPPAATTGQTTAPAGTAPGPGTSGTAPTGTTDLGLPPTGT